MEFVHTISNASEKASVIGDILSHEKKRSHHHQTISISQIESDDLDVFPTNLGRVTTNNQEGSAGNPAEILPYVEPEGQPIASDDEDDDDYEYEDEDDAPFSGFLVNDNSLSVSIQNTIEDDDVDKTEPATIRDEEEAIEESESIVIPEITNNQSTLSSTSQKWRQPSKAAISMSQRVDQETSGGKRRLAQDLYRIMNQDTQDAGFSLQPSEEDTMDRWTIKLFQFDEDSNLAKDMLVLGVENIELEMTFPDQYPFEPPFVRVVKPRFKRQTGFVMNGALCMELLTKDGWSPINDIESVIVSIRPLLVVGEGRLEAASSLAEAKYAALLAAAKDSKSSGQFAKSRDETEVTQSGKKRLRSDSVLETHHDDSIEQPETKQKCASAGDGYSITEAQAAHSHISDYHKKKGWDNSGWWSRKG